MGPGSRLDLGAERISGAVGTGSMREHGSMGTGSMRDWEHEGPAA